MKKAHKMMSGLIKGFILALAFAAPALGEIVNCAGTPQVINRGNEDMQDICTPFDYENPADYLNPGPCANRAVFCVGDCIPDGFADLVCGDIINISMEIFVDSGDGMTAGDNGVYWAEDISDGIPMETYASQAEACLDTSLNSYFGGIFIHLQANGFLGSPNEDLNCELSDSARVIKFQSFFSLFAVGYEVTEDDEINNKWYWAIDIPEMRTDPGRISGGEKIWVQICLTRDAKGGESQECCQKVYIGRLWGGIGDGIGLFDSDAGVFYIRNELSGGVADHSFRFGPTCSGWQPVSGDWNADGQTTIGLFDPSQSRFYLKNSHSGGAADAEFVFGPKGVNWHPIVGDWDGDGQPGIGLYDPVQGRFYLKNIPSAGAADHTVRFGPPDAGWQAIAGDWDGDETDSIGLYSPQDGVFYLKNSLNEGAADISFRFGPKASNWTAVCGDWNGDGIDGVGLFDPETSSFYLRNSLSAGGADEAFGFGPDNAGWTPMAGSW